MKSTPLTSVIIISYNNLCYIFDLLNSIFEQDYQNIELIISDDGTKDFNKQIYNEYILNHKKNNITKYLVHTNEINLGIVKNINNAISMSKGKYIKIIGADDVFYNKEVITCFVDYLEKTDSLVVASKIDTCDKILKSVKNYYYDNLEYNLTNLNFKQCFIELCKQCFIPAPGVCFTKKLFEKYGYFNQNYRLVEDWPMWLLLTRKECKIGYLNIISVKYRENIGASTVPNKIYTDDIIKCFNNEIKPYRAILGYWNHKKLVWHFVKKWEFVSFPFLQQMLFLLKNIDLIILYLLPSLLKTRRIK